MTNQKYQKFPQSPPQIEVSERMSTMLILTDGHTSFAASSDLTKQKEAAQNCQQCRQVYDLITPITNRHGSTYQRHFPQHSKEKAVLRVTLSEPDPDERTRIYLEIKSELSKLKFVRLVDPPDPMPRVS